MGTSQLRSNNAKQCSSSVSKQFFQMLRFFVLIIRCGSDILGYEQSADRLCDTTYFTNSRAVHSKVIPDTLALNQKQGVYSTLKVGYYVEKSSVMFIDINQVVGGRLLLLCVCVSKMRTVQEAVALVCYYVNGTHRG